MTDNMSKSLDVGDLVCLPVTEGLKGSTLECQNVMALLLIKDWRTSAMSALNLAQ